MNRFNNYAFIDGSNLHITYENIDWKLDYKKLRNYLDKRLGVSVAYFFIGHIKAHEDIYKKLQSYDYNILLKEPSPYYTEEEYCPYCLKSIAPKLLRYKCDCDSLLTTQVMDDISLYDKAVLITSDGDFDNLVRLLLRRDKLKMVFAPCRNGCSWLLKSAAKGRIEFIDDFKIELEKI